MVEFLGIDIYQWLKLVIAIAGTVGGGYAASIITTYVLKNTGTPMEIARKSGRIVKYVVWIMGAVLIVFYLAFDIVGALVGLGIFGVAVGIGLGTILSNLITGVVVVLGKSFKVGDEIKVAFFEGKVIRVSISRVVLETKDGELVFVPTAFFLSNPVSRKSREGEQSKYKNGE
jgi:small-conductance mechanosensitive channel